MDRTTKTLFAALIAAGATTTDVQAAALEAPAQAIDVSVLVIDGDLQVTSDDEGVTEMISIAAALPGRLSSGCGDGNCASGNCGCS